MSCLTCAIRGSVLVQIGGGNHGGLLVRDLLRLSDFGGSVHGGSVILWTVVSNRKSLPWEVSWQRTEASRCQLVVSSCRLRHSSQSIIPQRAGPLRGAQLRGPLDEGLGRAARPGFEEWCGESRLGELRCGELRQELHVRSLLALEGPCPS